MKVLIIPGLSSPNCEKYVTVYNPLKEETTGRIPNSTADILLLPGQEDREGAIKGEFSIPDASSVVRGVIEQCDDTQIALICRSTGCNVAAHLLAEWPDSPVQQAVFWGPPPFWLYYDMFVRNADTHYANAKDTGVRITEAIAQSATPFESLLKEVTCPIHICAGDEDPYCPPTYLAYLDAIFAKQSNIQVTLVPGCEHSVRPGDASYDLYVDTVFGWIRGDINQTGVS